MPDFIVFPTDDMDPAFRKLLKIFKKEVVSFQINADNYDAVCILERRCGTTVAVKHTWDEFRRSPGFVARIMKDPSIAVNRRAFLIQWAKRDVIEQAFAGEISGLSV